MKAWLKGGIIASALSLVSYIIYYSCGNNTSCLFINLYNPFVVFPMKILGRVGLIISSSLNISFIHIATVFALIFWFIIGVLIGLMVSKIRNKNEKFNN